MFCVQAVTSGFRRAAILFATLPETAAVDRLGARVLAGNPVTGDAVIADRGEWVEVIQLLLRKRVCRLQHLPMIGQVALQPLMGVTINKMHSRLLSFLVTGSIAGIFIILLSLIHCKDAMCTLFCYHLPV